MPEIIAESSGGDRMIRAFSRDLSRIPYCPDLRGLCGSVSATVLMGQIERLFDFHPEGFSKFMEPCSHSAYKQGESWTEVLAFSRKEFSTAFSKIGVAHKSRTAFEAAESPFGPNSEKFYYSYHDKRAGETHYRRNHEVVDRALAEFFPVGELEEAIA